MARLARLRYMAAYPRLYRRHAKARRVWRSMSPEARAQYSKPGIQGIWGTWDPRNGVVNDLPTISKPNLFPVMPGYGDHPTGHALAYLRWVLYSTSGYNVRPLANWGPWTYSAAVQQGVYNTKAFFGATPTYSCSETDDGWDLIDFLWAWNN